MGILQKWADINFQKEITRDGSPSLMLCSDGERGESMHHSGGAWSETDYIYGKPLRLVFARIKAPCILSVGLGLGYNEFLVAKIAHENNQSFQILSFESVQELRESFLSWIKQAPLSAEIQATYDQMASFVCHNDNLLIEELKKILRDAYNAGQWVLADSLTQEFKPKGCFHIALYDAFSGKTSPQLWEESFLIQFIQAYSDSDFIFSTYACRKSLKDAFQGTQLKFIQRDGFLGKRNSSIGLKGLFTQSQDSEIC